MTDVRIALLGGFRVRVDGADVADRAWVRRSASGLVKLLALAPDRTRHREQVLDALWPDLAPADAAPRLHTAAHYARRAVGDPAAVVLRGSLVTLWPDADVRVDVDRFGELVRAGAADDALELYRGDLLPEDLFEPWTEPARGRLRAQRLDLLRAGRRWGELLELEPADEPAHLALWREHAARGARAAVRRQFELLERSLRAELGVGPSAAAVALRDRLAPAAPAAAAPAGARLVEREPVLRRLDQLLSAERGGAAVVTGPAGAGVSAVLRWARERAASAGMRTGTGAASAETGWPYAPVLEAVADLCRQSPALLDGLADAYRSEIRRALHGEELTWTGEGPHQRLFLAVAELLRMAAVGTGAVLVLDDLQDADEASLRLVHYLARVAPEQRLALVLGRHGGAAALRRAAVELPLAPLTPRGTAALLAARLGSAPGEGLARDVHVLSGGLPGRVLELVTGVDPDAPGGLPLAALLAACPPGTREVLQRLAVAGRAADSEEFVALAGTGEQHACGVLDAAAAAGLLVAAGPSWRLRSPELRDALLADVPAPRLRALHREVAAVLDAGGAPPARVGRHLVRAGRPREAAPHLLAAAESAAAVGAYRDALDSLDLVRDDVPPADRPRVLALRADLLQAVGDPGARGAYRAAIEAAAPEDRVLLRVRLAREARMAGDWDTSAEVLAGLEPDGGPHDCALLVARGATAYFAGDLAAAAADLAEARRRLDGATDWRLYDLTLMEGLIAHERGEWFQRLRHELSQTRESPALATAVFDSHLCVAEYLLYGPTPYGQVMELGRGLRESARRSGSVRAQAFAAALTGEAALLSGDLARAEAELTEAVELHAGIGASAGEAHSLQRLAEVRLHQGRREEARRLLARALPRARWSPIAKHLLQRVHGTRIAAADTPEEAYALVARAEAVAGPDDECTFCQVLVAVPSAVACAAVGDLDQARRHLAAAERSTRLWPGTSLEAAVLEARAHLARAEGDGAAWRRLLAEAEEHYDAAGQRLDAERCRAAASPAEVRVLRG